MAAPADDDDYQSYDDLDEGNQLPPFSPRHPAGMHIGRPLLRNTITRAVQFFHLVFSFEMILEIVNHTNSYAYEHIMEGSHRSYAN